MINLFSKILPLLLWFSGPGTFLFLKYKQLLTEQPLSALGSRNSFPVSLEAVLVPSIVFAEDNSLEPHIYSYDVTSFSVLPLFGGSQGSPLTSTTFILEGLVHMDELLARESIFVGRMRGV